MIALCHVSGNLAESGVDVSAVIQLYYPDGQVRCSKTLFERRTTSKVGLKHMDNLGQVAVASCSATCQLQDEAYFCGDLGNAKNFTLAKLRNFDPPYLTWFYFI